MNNTDHTIGNTIIGGASIGRLILSYTSMLFFVNNADNPPTANAIAIAITYGFIFFHITITSVIFYAEKWEVMYVIFSLYTSRYISHF